MEVHHRIHEDSASNSATATNPALGSVKLMAAHRTKSDVTAEFTDAYQRQGDGSGGTYQVLLNVGQQRTLVIADLGSSTTAIVSKDFLFAKCSNCTAGNLGQRWF